MLPELQFEFQRQCKELRVGVVSPLTIEPDPRDYAAGSEWWWAHLMLCKCAELQWFTVPGNRVVSGRIQRYYFAECREEFLTQGNLSVDAALALHNTKHHALAVNVSHLEAAQLSAAQTRRMSTLIYKKRSEQMFKTTVLMTNLRASSN